MHGLVFLRATTHARKAREVERKLSNLMAFFARSGSSSDGGPGQAAGSTRRPLQTRQWSALMLPVRSRARDQWADAASTPGNPHEWSRRLVRTRPHRLRSQALAALTRSWTTADICHLQTTPRDRALSPAALGSDDGRCRPAAISNAVPAAELTMSIRAWVGQRPGRPITGELVSVSTAIRASSVRRRWQTRCRTARCNP
jgi:hypothetical protein